ncbi:MAG: cation-efflux pump [Chloroflexi bacterium]|nr:cation-efflux pump [Chloroflexota bacterium]
MSTFRAIRNVLYYTMALNLAVTAAKLVVGYLTGSLSVIADGYDSLFDSASNIVGLVGIYIAARPSDPSHPYGHRKFETLAAVSISGLLFVTMVELVQSAIARLREPQVPEINAWTFAALLFSIAMHWYVAWYEYRRGQQLKSQVLMADSLHTRADVLVSFSVLVGMIVVRLGFPIVDPILALIIALVIGKIGVDIIRESSNILTDAAALEEQTVRDIAMQVPGVTSLHRIRSRGQEGDIYLDLHIRVDPKSSIDEAHAIAHHVQRHLVERIEGVRDVIVHVEPQAGISTPQAAAVHEPMAQTAQIRQIAGRVPNTSVHSVRAQEIDGRLYIQLHLEVEPSLSLVEAHELANRVENMLRAEVPELDTVDIHIEPTHSADNRPATIEDQAYVDVRNALDQATAQVSGIGGPHDVRILRQGQELLVSGHWESAAGLSIEEAHELSRQLEQRIREKLAEAKLPQAAEVLIHVEPREE